MLSPLLQLCDHQSWQHKTPLADYDDAMRQLHLAQQREEAAPRSAPSPRVSDDAASAAAGAHDSAQGRHRDNRDRSTPAPETEPDSDSDSDDGDTTDVVGPMAPADATPGTTVAVEFNLRRGRGVRFFKGTVLRLNAATARVRFREFHNTYLDYAVKHSRLFIPSPTAD